MVKRKKGLWLLIFIMISLASGEAMTQISLPDPYHIGATSNWFWSSDSQNFVFEDFAGISPATQIAYGQATHPDLFWYNYNIASGSITRSSIWTLQPNLTDSDFDALQIIGSTLDIQSFVFAGPNNLFAYMANSFAETNPIGISDGQSYVLTSNAYLISAFTDLQDFYMRWNENGTAFAAYNYTGSTTLVAYATGFGVSGALSSPMSAQFFQPLADRDLGLRDKEFPLLFDVASTADEVLLLINDFDLNNPSSPPQETLMIWNPLVPEMSIVFDSLKGRTITGAVFAPGDDSKIIFIDETGIHTFDRDTSTTSLLTAVYTNTLFQKVLFSPDGYWLAASSGTSMYMIDIGSLQKPIINCNVTVDANNTSTLAAAITSANTTPEADTICLEGTYTLTASHNSGSDGPNGLPVITSDITLHGLGSGATILRDSAAPAFRILKVDTGARLVLENITISGGDAGSGSGGGIRNLGTLELRDSVVENNLPDNVSGEGSVIQTER